MNSLVTVRVGLTGSANHNPDTGELPGIQYVSMQVPTERTLGQIWVDFAGQRPSPTGSWPGWAPPYVYASAAPLGGDNAHPPSEEGTFLHFSTAHILGEEGGIRWSVPWMLIRVMELERLYPHAFQLQTADPVLHLTWTPRPQMGQGWGLDWSQFPDWIELLQRHWAFGALTVAVTARDGINFASDIYQRTREKVNAGADALRRKLQEWQTEDVHVSDISFLVADENLDEHEKARILDLTEEEVAQIRALLSPASENIPPEIWDGLHSLSAQKEIALDPRETPPPIYRCGCNKEWCETEAIIVPTAPGVKVGLATQADHFTFSEDTLKVIEAAGRQWRDQ